MSVRELKGGAELDRFLAELPVNLVRKVMRGAALAGAGVIRDEARVRVRRKSGKTAKAIKTSARVAPDGQIVAKVKLRGAHSFVGYLLESGVLPHLIAVSDSLRPERMTRHGARKTSIRTMNQMMKRGSLVIGGQFIGQSVLHPGFAATPFLRPALDAKADEAINVMGVYIRQRLTLGNLRAPTLAVAEVEE